MGNLKVGGSMKGGIALLITIVLHRTTIIGMLNIFRGESQPNSPLFFYQRWRRNGTNRLAHGTNDIGCICNAEMIQGANDALAFDHKIVVKGQSGFFSPSEFLSDTRSNVHVNLFARRNGRRRGTLE